MIRKVLKWSCVGLLAILAAGIAYLAVQPDPGPYLVALRSDTPEQAGRALDAILAAEVDTPSGSIQYDGATFPPVSTEDLAMLGLRFYRKATGQAREPMKGDTSTWMDYSERVRRAVIVRRRPSR
ncbi:MAG: hypothetical protein A3G34_00300 [Candidatus Lindowbacteria bacterium RIFCSPLOWO2_12_FULL_62_27]|nr:MAG: hypothetical protein A3G34_00300 [Candidatus Lindowbacteria bacterium RIFCSPLOWO2_12_FULL_62_27]OGH63389.1 MAG: hypothetical protein A3I06_08370 [Candidatus Lindowbacteria bacterium RIFCSPLOWO2_02_FULL_62_12]